jgi:hypothetical protein
MAGFSHTSSCYLTRVAALLDTGANNPKYWCSGFNEGQTIFFFTSSVLTFEIKNETEREKKDVFDYGYAL